MSPEAAINAQVINRYEALRKVPHDLLHFLSHLALHQKLPETRAVETSPEAQMERVRRIHEALKWRTHQLRQDVVFKIDKRLASDDLTTVKSGNRLLRSLQAADAEVDLNFSEHGVDVSPDWAFEIVASMIRGDKVDFQIEAPAIGMRADGARTKLDAYEPVHIYQNLAITRLIADLQMGLGNISTSFDFSRTGYGASEKATAISMLQDSGFPNPIIQSLVNMVPSMESVQEGIVKSLISSGKGRFEEILNTTYFVPEGNLAEWQEAHVGLEGQPQSGKVPIACDRGGPPHEMLEATRVLSRIDKIGDSMHVRIGGINTMYSKGARVLLKAIGKIDWGGYQEISINFQHECSAYAVARTLLGQVERFINSYNLRTADFAKMNSENYFSRNYAEMIAQDESLAEMEISMRDWFCDWLDLDPENDILLEDDELAHMCIGPDYGTVMNSIKLSGGRVMGYDYSLAHQHYLARVKQGLNREVFEFLEQHKIGLDQRISGNPDANFYAGTYQDVIDRLEIEQHDIHFPLERKARFVRMSFGAEAATEYRLEFRDMLKSIHDSMVIEELDFKEVAQGLADVVRPKKSVLVCNITLDYTNEGWSDGAGNHFPGTKLNESHVRAALIDAGFKVVACRVAAEDLPDDERLRPGERMLYVVAVPEEQAKHLGEMQTSLPQYVLAA